MARSKAQHVALLTRARPSELLLGYLLSDVIASRSIRDELDRLGQTRATAIAALKANLLAELAQPTWPRDSLGRAALALFLLAERPRHGLFIHPHEKRKAGNNDPSGIRLRVPRGRA
jgi:hypothetical protein